MKLIVSLVSETIVIKKWVDIRDAWLNKLRENLLSGETNRNEDAEEIVMYDSRQQEHNKDEFVSTAEVSVEDNDREAERDNSLTP